MSGPQAHCAKLVRGFLQLCDRSNGIWILTVPQLSLCLCLPPQLLSPLMLAGFLSPLLPNSYGYHFNLCAFFLVWGANKESYSTLQKQLCVKCVSISGAHECTFAPSCTAVQCYPRQLVNTTHWGVTWLHEGAHPISHLATTALPSYHETLSSAPCLVPLSMQTCPCRNVYW